MCVHGCVPDTSEMRKPRKEEVQGRAHRWEGVQEPKPKQQDPTWLPSLHNHTGGGTFWIKWREDFGALSSLLPVDHSSSCGLTSRRGSPALAHGPCTSASRSPSHGALSPVTSLSPPPAVSTMGQGPPPPLSPVSRTGSHPNWVFSTFLLKGRKSSQVTNLTPSYI